MGTLAEGGLYHKLVEDCYKLPLLDGLDKIDSTATDCLSESLVTHPPEFDSLTPSNLHKLFLVCGCLVGLATVVLVYENIKFRIEEKNRKERRRYRNIMKVMRDAAKPKIVQMENLTEGEVTREEIFEILERIDRRKNQAAIKRVVSHVQV